MKYINLLPSTIITNGINNSCFIDVEKSLYTNLPLTLSNLFTNNKSFCYETIYNKLEDEDKITFEEYILFLKNNNFISITSYKFNFIHFDKKTIEIPYSIKDAIIDADSKERLLDKLLFFTDKPEVIQIRLFFEPNYKTISELVDFLYKNDFLNIEIVLNYNIEIKIDSYKEVFLRYNNISRFVIMNYRKNKSFEKFKMITLKEKLINKFQCGIISEKLFMPNIRTVATSKSCNSCLYKKISIDKDGNIKNCPSMPQSFGTIKETTVEEALNHPDFKKYWNVNKDMIAVCKDCEFRHICTDCRAYTERTHFDGEIDLSKPLKCGYNPYTNEWAEWSTNPLKEKAIQYYGMHHLVKKDA
jgi:SPASM domain peptide maturase of grasp-with-spasm system